MKGENSKYQINKLIERVVNQGICVGCGACVCLDSANRTRMKYTNYGPVPIVDNDSVLSEMFNKICPAVGVNYPELYKSLYGSLPENWLVGKTIATRVGFTSDPDIRRNAASAGIITQTLIYLLENRMIDAVILAKQGVPSPAEARPVIVDKIEDIKKCSQSVYIPVSMLEILPELEPDKEYAITCVPEQSSALRMMQKYNISNANCIKYVLGPYTGTALYPDALNAYLRMKRVKNDSITKLEWRAGEWPGSLRIELASGKVISTPKIYYNFLIPFFVTQTSLQSMDFINEFADLAVGDAWSPDYELKGEGFSVFSTRNTEMESIVQEMIEKKIIDSNAIDPLEALSMHGHMLDFKKRGGWIRNERRIKKGKLAPDYGYAPLDISIARKIVEAVNIFLFNFGSTYFARRSLSLFPETILGPLFNKTRLFWKKISKPTKRKGLSEYKVRVNEYNS